MVSEPTAELNVLIPYQNRYRVVRNRRKVFLSGVKQNPESDSALVLNNDAEENMKAFR